MRWFFSDPHFGHFNVINYSNRPFLFEARGSEIYFQNELQETTSNEKEAQTKARTLSLKLMEDTFINNWNAKVQDGDTVYLLGDFAFAEEKEITRILKLLKGIKILIEGNHDHKKKIMLRCGFSEVHETLTINVGGREVILNHYPYVHPELNELAERRPNIIKLNTKTPKNPEMPKTKLSYEKSREYLKQSANNHINLGLEGAAELHKFLLKLISTHIGSRLVNEGKMIFHGHTHSEVKRVANMFNFSVEARNYEPYSEEQALAEIIAYEQELTGATLTEENFENPEFQYYSLRHKIIKDQVSPFKIIQELINTYFQQAYAKEKNEEFKTLKTPQDYSPQWYELNLKLKGFIPKTSLVVGAFYQGDCRNASWAQWSGTKWRYIRTKWGSDYIDEVEAIEDDQGYDVFIPWSSFVPSPEQIDKFDMLSSR